MSKPTPSSPETLDLAEVQEELLALRARLLAEETARPGLLRTIHPSHRDSARNLLHYLALRRHDLRPLQRRLARLGLSSLGRAESHVLATVDAVLRLLRLATGQPTPASASALPYGEGEQRLAETTQALLGSAAPGRDVRIMVTLPEQAAHDYALVHDLLAAGMECARINCAHDDSGTWLRMIEHLRRAESELGRRCKLVMDLGGPKLRTGAIEPGPAVVRIRPQRDALGRVTAPARVWLVANGEPPPSPAAATLPVPGRWLAQLRVGDRLRFTDARDARRLLRVAEVTAAGVWAELRKTAYLVPGTLLKRHHRKTGKAPAEARLGALPHLATTLHLGSGEPLVLGRGPAYGKDAKRDQAGRLLRPARIACSIPSGLDDLRPGEPVWFDDGKIGGVIESVRDGSARVRIGQVHGEVARLGADKGINLPESHLRLDALTTEDIENLPFVARHADIVELSFCNSAHDVEQLQRRLRRLGDRLPAIVVKIETRKGFENLPEILLAAMRWPSCGVMIARGDLAVECGFERLAEVQEEILWISEAAHVPVIWATQVLESLAKHGLPSRAEITDAAMGHRAECVMLNKGPHVLQAVRTLDDILRRMREHQSKKQSMLRALHLAHGPANAETPPHTTEPG